MGGAVVTANVEGVGGVQQAKFWAHSTRKIQAETMHSKLCLLHTANHFFFKKNEENRGNRACEAAKGARFVVGTTQDDSRSTRSAARHCGTGISLFSPVSQDKSQKQSLHYVSGADGAAGVGAIFDGIAADKKHGANNHGLHKIAKHTPKD